jgi:2-desacetyl-2-hydroxyethyl bacteriochlorophyllide A dehydrogenase
MKSVQVVARGRAEFIEVAKPEVRPGYVLVRTAHLALCGSDIRMLHYAPDASYPFPPGTTGHEMVGTIDAVADGDSNFKVGDQVLALAPGHRAMCEYFLAPIEHVIPLPAGKPIDVLLQAQQFGTVMYASQRLPNLLGKDVVVIGQGSAGLWFNFLLPRLGAKRVIALDQDAHRLHRSKTFGATHAIHSQSEDPVEAVRNCLDGQLADLVVEAAGEVEAINLAIDLVKQYGEILYFGVPRGQIVPFNFDEYFHKCCRATSIVGATAEHNQQSTRMALELIAAGKTPAELLITHHVKFTEVMDAYEMHRTRADGCLKIVIDMPGAS